MPSLTERPFQLKIARSKGENKNFDCGIEQLVTFFEVFLDGKWKT
jgi:hypothetical protein